MSNIAISVENLGKCYQIGELENYYTLRDSLTNIIKYPFKLISNGGDVKKKSEIEYIWALKDVNFEVKHGEIIGIIGRNGAGKSTLLKVLSRITTPTEGRVKINGRVGSLLEVGTGFHPELTGRENIYLNGSILGMSKKEIERKFDEIVDFAEIEKFLDTPVKRYSSGMYVRLAFAVAAHMEPEILIIDEVLAVGDIAFQKKCLGKMDDVSKQGRTILFVSHNMTSINQLCEKSILLEEGQIVEYSQTEIVLNKYFSMQLNTSTKKYNLNNNEISNLRFYTCDKNYLEKNLFKTSDEIGITIEFSCFSNTKGLRIGFDLFNYRNECIFRSFDDDINQIERNGNTFKKICIISPNLLQAGTYEIRLQIGIHNIKWLIDGTVNKFFDVEHLDGVNKHYADYRPGIIMPELEWAEGN